MKQYTALSAAAPRRVAAAGTAGPSSTLAITTEVLHDGVVGRDYGAQIGVQGGLPPYAFALVVGGELPPGIRLSNSGLMSGTPNSVGRYTFRVRVNDAANPAAIDERDFTIEVSAAESTDAPAAASNSLIQACDQLAKQRMLAVGRI